MLFLQGVYGKTRGLRKLFAIEREVRAEARGVWSAGWRRRPSHMLRDEWRAKRMREQVRRGA